MTMKEEKEKERWRGTLSESYVGPTAFHNLIPNTKLSEMNSKNNALQLFWNPLSPVLIRHDIVACVVYL